MKANLAVNVWCQRFLPLIVLTLMAGTLLPAGCTTEAPRTERNVASEEFEQAADRPPTSKTLYTMARILIAQGREGEAQYILVRIIHDDPAYVPAYCAMADMQLRAQKVEDAEKTLLAGFANAPKDPVLLNDLGMCKVACGDYEGALVYFNHALQVDPRTPRYAANRAMALGMLGRYEESLEGYYSIVTPEFTQADAHYNVAVLCDARGDAQGAAAEFALADQIRELQKKSKGAPKESKPTMPVAPNADSRGRLPQTEATAPVETAPAKADKQE